MKRQNEDTLDIDAVITTTGVIAQIAEAVDWEKCDTPERISFLYYLTYRRFLSVKANGVFRGWREKTGWENESRYEMNTIKFWEFLDHFFDRLLGELSIKAILAFDKLPQLAELINGIDLSPANLNDIQFAQAFEAFFLPNFKWDGRDQFLAGSMSELLFGLAELPDRPVVIHINAGLGGLVRHLPQGSTFMGYEDWELPKPLLYLRTLIHGVGLISDFHLATFKMENRKADFVLAFPPLNSLQVMYPLRPLESEVQQATRLVKEMLDALDDDGTAILLLPRPNSPRQNDEKLNAIKKAVLESRCLQAVISITNASYNHLGIETALLLMRKNPLFQGRIRLLEAPRIGQETHEIREIDISKTLENFKAESQNIAAFDLEPSELVNWDYSRTLLQHRLQERHQKEARSLNPMQQQLEKLGQLIWKAEAIAETALGLPLFEIDDLGTTPRISFFERPDLSLLDVVKESDKDYKTFSLKIPHFLVSPWNPVIDKIALPVSDEQIAVSNRLLVFRDGPSNADVDFILLQLNSEFLRDQLNILGNFQRLKEITVDEFLDLHVVIELDVAEQRRIVKKHKLRLLDGKKEELKHQKQRLGIEDAETKILEILGHELRPLLSNVNNHTVLTQHYIQEKAVSKEPISLCHKLGERVDSHTISSSFELIQKNLKRMGNLIDSLEGILDADVSKMNLRRVSLFEEWHDRLNRMALENEISCLAICEKNTRDFPNHGDFAVNLDEAAFEIAISNLFSNAFKHGFEDAGFENRFLCMFSCQEAYDGSMWVILDIMNNGKPMPEGMTTEKFIELGGSMGETKGSGIGGFLVHKIIENHAGKFRLMYPGEIGYHLMGLEQANLFQPQKMNLGRKAFNVGFRIEIPYCHDGIEAKS